MAARDAAVGLFLVTLRSEVRVPVDLPFDASFDPALMFSLPCSGLAPFDRLRAGRAIRRIG
ncbi:MAG: hypothetical protein RRA32_10915 [bacterium]|nr:hypothetical protein [bacterium]